MVGNNFSGGPDICQPKLAEFFSNLIELPPQV